MSAVSVEQAIDVLAQAVARDIRDGLLVTRETAERMLDTYGHSFHRLNLPKIKFGDAKQSGVRYRVSDITRLVKQLEIANNIGEKSDGSQ